jgi:hypothetical protein
LDSNWAFSLSSYYYLIPDEKNLVSFIGYADYKHVHLEGRYNYEDRQTASLFGGWRLDLNGRIKCMFIPMLGVMFGDNNGVAAGLEINVNFKRFDYYSETEYVVDFNGADKNFLYTWGELTFTPLKSLHAGISYQRTLLYETGFDVQRGLMAKYSFRKITLGGYYFNPFSSNYFFILSAGIEF